ncbi:MAG: type II secretion system protein [Candidatus Omnitrophica bacterium]|nr:type II secretion system protein [Candidatus Omnitrophota bacterium]
MRGFLRLIKRKEGYSLIEILITVAIVGLIISLGMPSYKKSVEMSRARFAWQTLKSIRNGERGYRLERGNYLDIAEGAPDATWNLIQMENPDYQRTKMGYKFSVESEGAAFSGRATRVNSAGQGLGAYTIDEAGQIQKESGADLPEVAY